MEYCGLRFAFRDAPPFEKTIGKAFSDGGKFRKIYRQGGHASGASARRVELSGGLPNAGKVREMDSLGEHDNRSQGRGERDYYHDIARLAGGLAHEIKNPLSTIRLNLELLAEDFAEPETPREKRAARKIEIVYKECERLQTILDDFLKFTRARQLKLVPCQLNGEVRQLLDFYAPKAKEAGIEVIDYLSSSLPTVMLDPEAFRSALWNLIINAEQAMPEGGQIVVRTTPCPDGVRLDLIDTGCGMDAQILRNAFDAFYSTKRNGSGLGLAITKQVIEAHGGRIFVQSERGKGTQFSIVLPTPPRLQSEEQNALAADVDQATI